MHALCFENINWKFKYDSRVCKIHSEIAHGRTEKSLFWNYTGQFGIDDEDVLKEVITDDESWVNGYDRETKQQSTQRKYPSESRPKKFSEGSNDQQRTLRWSFEKIAWRNAKKTAVILDKWWLAS